MVTDPSPPPEVALAAVTGTHGGLVVIDERGEVLFFTPAFAAMLAEPMAVGSTLWGLLSDAMAGVVRGLVDDARAVGTQRVAPVLVPCASGWVRVVATPTTAGTVVHLVDATLHRSAEERVRRQQDEANEREEDFDALLASWGMLVSYVDADLRYTRFYNVPAGRPKGSYLGKRAYEFADSPGGHAVSDFQLEVLESNRSLRREVRYASDDGERAWLLYGEPLRTRDGAVHGVKTVGLDVTDLRNAESAAKTDYLTGLPNRRAMDLLVGHELARSERRGSAASVIMLDIDHFKSVNDGHGHATGDAVLRSMVACLQEELRSGDTMARWGGEEFLVLLPDTSQEDAANVAERMRQRVERHPFPPVGRITVCLGVATGDRGECAEGLIARADAACLRAKRLGRNAVALGNLPSERQDTEGRARAPVRGPSER